MFINKDSIVINNENMGKYIVEAKFGYHKIWGKDTGRNLNFKFVGSLGGIFSKITLQFKPLTQTELETLAPILDSAYQTFSYYDPYKKAQTTMTTYTGDWEVLNKNIIGGLFKNEGFSCAFISIDKRS